LSPEVIRNRQLTSTLIIMSLRARRNVFDFDIVLLLCDSGGRMRARGMSGENNSVGTLENLFPSQPIVKRELLGKINFYWATVIVRLSLRIEGISRRASI